MLDRSLLSDVVEQALKHGGDFAEVYVEEKHLSNVLCEDSRVEKINSGREKGAGIRVIKDGYTAYVFTNDLTEDGLQKAAKMAGQAAKHPGEHRDLKIDLKKKEAGFQMDFKRWPEELGFDEKVEHVLAANRIARDLDDEIRQVTVAIGDVHKKVQIANSDGDYIEDEWARIRMLVQAIAARDGQIQTGYETAGGVVGYEILDQVSMEEMAEKAGRRAIEMLSARPAPAGKMPVIMHSEAGGTMIHEACGHGLEADLSEKGLSVYKDKIGEQVAADIVTVVDDATIPYRYGSYHFDDEGTPGQRTVLIENGVLKAYMNDRMTAEKQGVKLTGNGRRESYQHRPIPRMTNTFIAPGQDDPDRIIRETEQGLLVKRMGGGQVNTVNGDFVFDVQEGYLIEDGEVTVPVRGATLTGNGPRALMDIDRVGTDLGFALGVCGKDGQGVPVGDAQPTIRIKELTVGGLVQEGSQGRIRRR